MKRSLLSLFLTLVAFSSTWAYYAKVDDIYYNLNSSTKTAEVTFSSNEYSGSVTIPSSVTYNGVTYSVTSIGDNAFADCSNLTSVDIPYSVTSISDHAFYGCKSLTSVEIPNSVTSIGDYAFNECDGLPVINNIRYADTYLVETVDRSCSSVTIKADTKWIGSRAFYDCASLTSVEIPNSVTSIGDYACVGCSGLETIIVEKGNSQYFSEGNCVIDKENCVVIGCKNSVIPSFVTSIRKNAFYGCKGLTSVEIPNSVTSIGFKAFYECSNLTSITIGNSVTSIGNYAFYGCKGLASVEIPNSVTSIGSGALEGCSNLKSITIPNSVTSIGDFAFYNCSDLTSVTIPNSVTSIGEYTFYKSSSLTSVFLGTGLKSISWGAFEGCSVLKEMVCHSTDFINCDGNPFYDSGYESGTLYVPASLIGAYRTTDPWYNWGSIKTLDDWAAGIELPTTSTDASPIYDLQGRRQSSMRKGINIIGGKKYLAK